MLQIKDNIELFKTLEQELTANEEFKEAFESNHIVLVPDAYTDFKPKEKKYPDYFGRLVLGRHISAFCRGDQLAFANIQGQLRNLTHDPNDIVSVDEIESREAKPYDEKKVMENIIKQGLNVIKAHLEHLKDHGETELLKQAREVLNKKNIKIDIEKDNKGNKHFSGCPGAKAMDFSQSEEPVTEEGERTSQLRQWPVQLHLVSPMATYFQGKDVVLAADCVAYALADFHKNYLKGKSLAIACPKLDSEQEVYVEKITALIDQAKIKTLTVMTMKVPYCSGLLMIAKKGAEQAKRKIQIKHVIVSIKGKVLTLQKLLDKTCPPCYHL